MTSRELAAVRVAKALSDPTRFRLLRELAAREEVSCQELTHGEVRRPQEVPEITKPAATRELPDLLRPEFIQRSAEVFAEPLDVVGVGIDGPLGQIADQHVFGHPLGDRGQGAFLMGRGHTEDS